jgi:glucose/arabinose dehydrogenase
MSSARSRAVAFLVVALMALALAPTAGAVDQGLLPDLDQEAPGQLQIAPTGARGHRRWWLGFSSAVSNVGAGPLKIAGHRADASTPAMVADQVIDGPSPEVIPNVGQLRYVHAGDHQHWHLIHFDRYELRRAGSTRAVVRDRKSGFCLGDRYRVEGQPLLAAPPQPVITGRCGLRQPGLLDISEGISVGYGDVYNAYLEYQQLELSGLRNGRYVLVHRVDADGRLREVSEANNSASVLLDVRWRNGSPYVRQLRTCPNTARCDRPPPKASSLHVRTMGKGLVIPWDIAFLPDGRSLVTERPGRVRLLEADGSLQEAPVATVPVRTQGEGGLLGIVLDPAFATNSFAYLYYTAPTGMKLERWRWTGSALVPDATLVDAIRAGEVHDSGRIGFGPDGRLYLATGDAGEGELAQNPLSLNGKFLALTPEEYHGSQTVWPAVVASGMRNPQGFDWQPGTGALVSNDHGPSGFDGPEGYDEVDLIVPGGNYGWPDAIGSDTGSGRFRAPLRVYKQPIAPSGGTFLHHPGTAWTGDYVLAALRGSQLRRLTLRNGRVVSEHTMFSGRFGRLRTVREAPNGDLCVLTSNRDGRGTPRPGDDQILCVTPPPR